MWAHSIEPSVTTVVACMRAGRDPAERLERTQLNQLMRKLLLCRARAVNGVAAGSRPVGWRASAPIARSSTVLG